MKTFLVVNSKGGSGKSTLATNLASYYALWKVPVALVDYDPQRSAMDWVSVRNRELVQIHGVSADFTQPGYGDLPDSIERVIIDSPARISESELRHLFQLADCAIMPVLPSPLDIRATGHFIGELMLDEILRLARLGLVANRVRTNTIIFNNLKNFLSQMKIPLVTYLRDDPSYLRAAESGLGIFEMPETEMDTDIEQWQPLIDWLEKE